jgi:hypothetical protein
MRITQSLPRGVIDEVLDASSRALHFPEPGSGFGLGVDSDDIARTAARRLTESAVVLSGNVFGHGFFDAMNQVSTTRYEKRVGVGRFLLGSSKSADMEQQLSLRDAVPVREIRTLRKLLEVSRGRGSAVLTDGSLAFGFGELKGAYDPATESVFEVVISGHGRWDLRHAEQGLVAFENGAPRLPQQRLSRERFANIASRVFVNSACDVEKLWAMSEAAADAEHGTMLVVSAAAVEESERLRGQALALEPTSIEPILVRQVTSIDGAVLVKPDGDVVAIGVILDGLATGSGDRARGARFNSALRYLEAGRAPTLIVLVSEDGLINLLPDLRPQVSRAEIAFLMDRLRAAADIDPVDPEKFYDVFKELEARAFYLDQDQVDEVNSLREDHWNRRREAGAQVWIVDSPLKPDPEMSDEYLVD